MTTRLRVNIKSLAGEATILREEASKTHGRARWDLNHHRTTTVRREARAAQLLYAFARGVPRSVVEGKRKELDEYHAHALRCRVREKAKRFKLDPDAVLEWFDNT